MNRTYWIAILVVLACCDGRERHNDAVVQNVHESRRGVSAQKKLQTFLSKFKDITDDTFKIESSEKFKGIELDTSEFVWLPASLREVSKSDPFFYACFKFEIDFNHTGLIMRTPSTYSSSSIKLFILNRETYTIFNTFTQLAESVGDGGFVSITSSWVTLGKFNQIVIWTRETEDKSIEDEKATNVVVKDHAILMRLKTSTVDTVVMESNDALKLYNKIENKQK